VKSNAGKADEADHASKADEATLAQTANEASHASEADHATDADKAANADAATVARSLITEGATRGIIGNGVQIGLDEDGTGFCDTDTLTVRTDMIVMRLVIREVKSVGGVLVVSNAAGKVSEAGAVDFAQTQWGVTFADDPGFQVGDLVRCSRFDTATNELRQYWVKVTFTSGNVYTLSSYDGSAFTVEVGDEIVLMGNTDAKSGRDGFIIISSENGIESVSVYSGVNTPTSAALSAGLKCRLGALRGITDSDFGQLAGYGLYAGNAYLKGKLIVSSGAEAGEEITKLSNAIDLTVKQDDITKAGVSLSSEGIVLTADKTLVKSSTGTQIAAFTTGADGKPMLRTSLINASELVANHYIATDDGGNILSSFNELGDGCTRYYYPGTRQVQQEEGPKTVYANDGSEILTTTRYYSEEGSLLWWLGPSGLTTNSLPYVFEALRLSSDSDGAMTAKALSAEIYYRFNSSSNDRCMITHDSDNKLAINTHTYAEHDGEIYTETGKDDLSTLIPDGTYWAPEAVVMGQEQSSLVADTIVTQYYRMCYEISGGRIISQEPYVFTIG
jgi:hypothetical protein